MSNHQTGTAGGLQQVVSDLLAKWDSLEVDHRAGADNYRDRAERGGGAYCETRALYKYEMARDAISAADAERRRNLREYVQLREQQAAGNSDPALLKRLSVLAQLLIASAGLSPTWQ